MWQNIRRGFDAFMVLIYVSAGGFMIVEAEYFGGMTSFVRIGFGSVLLSYGLFRLYKLVMTLKEQKDNVEDENV